MVNNQPDGHPTGSPLPRSPTLEAQRDLPATARGFRRWAKAIFAVDDIPDDPAEQQLKNVILNSEGDERVFLRGLLSDYTRFKNSRGGVVCRELSQCFTFTDGTHDG
jgi:hypothetical protein